MHPTAMPVGPLQQLVRSARRQLHRFFDGADRADENPDPLLDVVQQYPAEAAWFIKVVMFYGSLSSLVIIIPCGVFLAMYWDPCRLCNRPLRCWLLMHCLLQLLQAPVRLVFFYRLREVQRLNGEIQECVRQLTQAPAWRTSKAVSIASYAWFVLGVVWLLNSSYCEPCPGLYRLALTVVISSFAKLLVTLLVFHRCFPARGEGTQPPKPKGATQELIDALPLIMFEEEASGSSSPGRCRGDTSCAVCICDFEGGEMLRQLPCSHMFHRQCIDRWLRRNKVCPLCLRDVEAPPPESKTSAFARRLLGERPKTS
eukprot:TRINITY_DN34189_c0_g1_i1.p1 TRINITY_DN34189_c0_g1~~TRINITY_DN34189_c0_g1_i1.p1  ORF type:complete len:313 (-),score=46.46 TRINITY_DN34189_c0_g1_i1:74-1012(-)